MWCGWRTGTAESERGTAAYLGLGSNVGDRREHLARALRGLARIGDLDGVSSVYSTEPVGFLEQRWFWNLVVRLRTRLDPRAILAETRALEYAIGRRPAPRHRPRIIDIDLLLHGEAVLHDGDLDVPHAAMMERAFVLRPLVELAPDLVHPETGERIADRLARGTFERTRRLFPGSALVEP
jgi:2-amino-4-hydroxy-6-hydroxymethyldihydropteridine diphosphokinase